MQLPYSFVLPRVPSPPQETCLQGLGAPPAFLPVETGLRAQSNGTAEARERPEQCSWGRSGKHGLGFSRLLRVTVPRHRSCQAPGPLWMGSVGQPSPHGPWAGSGMQDVRGLRQVPHPRSPRPVPSRYGGVVSEVLQGPVLSLGAAGLRPEQGGEAP